MSMSGTNTTDRDDFRKQLKTTGKYVDILHANGFFTITDLLHFYPRTYEDRRDIRPLSMLNYAWGTEITKAKVVKKWMIRTPTGKKLIEIKFVDEEWTQGSVNALNNQFLLRATKVNSRYYVIWKPQREWSKVVFWHPDLVEATETNEVAGLVWCIYPVYSDLQGIKSAWFSKKLAPVIDQALEHVTDPLPQEFYERYWLLEMRTMLRTLHKPEDLWETDLAKKTIFFKRLLRLQLHSQQEKNTYQTDSTLSTQSNEPQRNIITEFLSLLPFELTGAQKRSLKEIIEWVQAPKPMLRLLQWDVGSGKTIVATAAAWYVHQVFKGQTAFLAPLEVLAQQHHKTLAKLLLPLWVRVELLTGSITAKEKKRIKDALADGRIDVIVWTHAIIQDDVSFHNLTLAVIDEQHKFWVRQRAYLQRHWAPHLLQMTATPIPRSMALAFFGEFDVSTIDEMPAWRKPIYTKIVAEKEYDKLKPRVMTKIGQGQKVFCITPLIEESENLENVKSAKQQFMLIKEQFEEIHEKIWLLHGKMKPSEKDQVMQDFKTGKYVMLVSTTVIEVGIDIPEATVMIIYNSERFGLSQLHQLRWRVGRSDIQSYCFLETPKKSGDTYQRLKHLETVHDGFELSEIDLRYRGPGEFLWVRQSGETDIPLDILMDKSLLTQAQEAALWLQKNHPDHAEWFTMKEWWESLLV